MGWYDAFRGDTARVNMGATSGGSAVKNFGDAFASIGGTIIAADAQEGKNKLIEMQLQNEQLKMDDAANKRADDHTQKYAASMTRDAWGKEKIDTLGKISDLETMKKENESLPFDQRYSDSDLEAGLMTAQREVESFYTPTKEMKQEWTGQEKIVQDNNNKLYLQDAFSIDPTLSKEERKAEDVRLRGLYKPETAQLGEIEKRFKAQDELAQTNFNNELREQATNFKTFEEFQKSPDYKTLLTNADAVGIEHVIDRFKLSDKDAAALRKTNAEIKHYDNADSIAQQELDLKRQKEKREAWEFKHPQAKSATGTERAEAETKVLKSVNDMVITQYGKTDSKGFTVIDPQKGEEAKWIHTRTISNVAKGMSPADAFNTAQISFKEANNTKVKKAAATADPLGLR